MSTDFTLHNLPREQAILDDARGWPEVDAQAIATYLRFLRAASDVFEALQTRLGRWELSEGKLVVLILLHRAMEQRLTPSEIAEQAGVTRGTITGLLAGLEQQGLVERLPHPTDHRMATIHLTGAGAELLSHLLPEHFRHVTALLGELSSQEQRQFAALLEKLTLGLPGFRVAEPAP